MVSVDWSTATPAGPVPIVTVAGSRPQPVVTCPLQVLPSMTDTVVPAPLPQFATYAVSVSWSTATSTGLFPTVTAGGRWLQPEGSRAVHVAPLMTETELLFELTT